MSDERAPGPGMVFVGRATPDSPIDLFTVKSVNKSKRTVTMIAAHDGCWGTYTVRLDKDGLLSGPWWRRVKAPRDIKPWADVWGRSGVDPCAVLRG